MSATIKEILEIARFAPSGDNCQSWIFEIYKDQLHIRLNSEVAKHSLNFSNLAAVLAMGGLYEYISIAALSKGLSTTVDWDFGGSGFLKFKGVITFVQSDVCENELVPWLKKRVTDRRSYTFDKQLIDEIDQKLAAFRFADDSVKVRAFQLEDSELVRAIAKCDSFMFKSDEIIFDILKWVRFKSDPAANDGMPEETLGLADHEVKIFKFLRDHIWFAKVLRALGTGFSMKMKMEKLLKLGKGVVIVTASSPDAVSLVQAGSAGVRAWLVANSLGGAVHPLTLASLPIYGFEHGYMKDASIESESKHYAKLFRLYKEKFKLEEGEVPVWLFRLGRAPSEEVSRAPRLSVEKLMPPKI